jgi:DHA1 family bicyclomycin/chloramphenicol resistance-like MFS transporter
MAVTTSLDPGAPTTSPAFRPAMIGLLGSMTALAAVTVDMYLPSLPTVAADLGTSAARVQLTISGVLLGAALGQLLIGPLSDRFGRRRPALAGIGLHVVASLLCIVAPTIGLLIGLRVAQGVGNAAATITAMAVIRDRLSGGPAARVISRLMLVIGVAPLFAPTLGGLIAGVAGWRAVFAVLALFGLALWVAVWRWLPETLPPARRTTAGVGEAVRGYRSLLSDRQFLALAVIPGLAMGALISYVLGSPFVLQEGFGLTAHQFALVFAVNGMALVIGSQVNAALLRRVTPIGILRVALPLVVTSGLVLLGFAVTGAGGLVGIIAPLWVMLFLLGFIMGNASAVALSRRGDRAGTAAAVIGATQAGVAGLVSSMVGLLGGGAVAMATVIVMSLGTALLVLILATLATRRRSQAGARGGNPSVPIPA